MTRYTFNRPMPDGELAQQIHDAGFTIENVKCARSKEDGRDDALMTLLRAGGVWETYTKRYRPELENGHVLIRDTIEDRWNGPAYSALLVALVQSDAHG